MCTIALYCSYMLSFPFSFFLHFHADQLNKRSSKSMGRNVNRKKWYFLPHGTTDKTVYWKPTQEYKPIAISNNPFFGGGGLWGGGGCWGVTVSCISELFPHLWGLPQIPIWTTPDGRMELMYSSNFYSVTVKHLSSLKMKCLGWLWNSTYEVTVLQASF